MTARSRRAAILAATISLVAGLTLSACTGRPAEDIDYAVDGALST